MVYWISSDYSSKHLFSDTLKDKIVLQMSEMLFESLWVKTLLLWGEPRKEWKQKSFALTFSVVLLRKLFGSWDFSRLLCDSKKIYN